MDLRIGKNRIHRSIAILGFVAAVALVLIIPNRFKEPDDWAYYYATVNFSHGHLTIGDSLHQQQVGEAQAQGGQLGQYVNIAPNTWALEKTPGYVFWVVPFYLLGVPQLANILLAAGFALAAYLLLKYLKHLVGESCHTQFCVMAPTGWAWFSDLSSMIQTITSLLFVIATPTSFVGSQS